MNAVAIEEAISQLADQPFEPQSFPYAFLEAFGNKETTIKRLRAGASNKPDLGGVLQTNNIHIATCDTGHVKKTLTTLKESPATAKAKAKFILAVARILHVGRAQPARRPAVGLQQSPELRLSIRFALTGHN